MRVVIPGPRPLCFERPSLVLRANTAEEVDNALDTAQAALESGRFCAGYLSYELGSVFASRPLRNDRVLPLLALGIFDAPEAAPSVQHAPWSLGPLRPRMDRSAYDHAIARIAHSIFEGDVYQVNFTVPFDFAFAGDAYALFCALLERSSVGHAAYVEDGALRLLSLSPELFLNIADGTVTTKPMKGTASLDRIRELSSDKNRAEHLMIVDLLRNDLHRVCTTVDVEKLYTVETYPTFATMTSSIAGKLIPGTRVRELLGATFPCGSITGAPKRAAMETIEALECAPRECYTGSIGFFAPDGTAQWNVAIRTLQIDTASGRGRLDVGGGIVADSVASSEWDEIALKARFMEGATVPFSLLETFAIGTAENRVAGHLARLQRSARHFGIAYDAEALRARIASLDAALPTLVRLRLRWDGRAELHTEPLAIPVAPVRIMLSSERVSSTDPLLAHKTSWRGGYDAALVQAREHDCFDAVLCNERGELADGARTTLFARFGGVLCTPPLASGALPGILRDAVLREGRAEERVMLREDLAHAREIYVGNSARGLLRAKLVKELSRV